MTFDLSLLNPYPSYNKTNEIVFQTEQGNSFEIYFSEGDAYFEGYEFAPFVKVFGFRQLQTLTTKVQTQRVAETIVYHLADFLQDERNISVYICNQSDNRQLYRKRLFDRWYKYYASEDFIKFDFDFDSPLFLSIITQKKNPYLQEFQESLPKVGGMYK